jgi:hypothetical protein
VSEAEAATESERIEALSPPAPKGLSPAELEALGVSNQNTIAEESFARVLVMGAAKIGKTTCIAKTAPKPLIINCDGLGATAGAANQGAEFLTVDVNSRASWIKARATARKLIDAGLVQTVIVDSISLLADNLLDEIKKTLEGYDVWTELDQHLSVGVKAVLALPAHVFIVSHMTPDYDGAAGVLPAVPGRSRWRLPGIVTDWVLLDVEPGRKPHERMFLCGPQKNWTYSGRNIRRSCAIEATVPALFAELGIAL